MVDATAVLDAVESRPTAEALERKAWDLAMGRVGSAWVPEWLRDLELRALTDSDSET